MESVGVGWDKSLLLPSLPRKVTAPWPCPLLARTTGAPGIKILSCGQHPIMLMMPWGCQGSVALLPVLTAGFLSLALAREAWLNTMSVSQKSDGVLTGINN